MNKFNLTLILWLVALSAILIADLFKTYKNQEPDLSNPKNVRNEVWCSNTNATKPEFTFYGQLDEVSNKYKVVIFKFYEKDGSITWGKLTLGDLTCDIVVIKK